MSTGRHCEVAVVGGGIVGLATALALLEAGRGRVVVLEAEAELARHQSGRNSGVLHSGIYYKPGSLKAELCVAGRLALEAFCERRRIEFRRSGKLIVAATEDELPRLDELERRGRANGLRDLARLDPAGIREVEPHARGVGGLLVPETGVVDFGRVTRELAAEVRGRGGEVALGRRLLGATSRPGGLVLETAGGSLQADLLVNCAGLQSDRVARLCGLEPRVRIVPFRGLYYEVVAGRRDLVRALIYPVPDPRFPFLGVHLTRRVDGRVEAGPNAVLALHREGYRRGSFALRDAAAVLGYGGFWRMAARWWRTGLAELRRSSSRGAFAADLRRLVPEIRGADLVPIESGIRAQAVDRAGRLIDDFHIETGERSVHVLNAPSPAATASLAIGHRIAVLAGGGS